ncbi:MAG: hypothetical protein F4W92_07365 [Gammaproteobacteria bacterium]|nr:hypothetical protein [Gammaproteobacteria bacterium]
MNLKDDKSNAPLESYYSAPKSSFRELLDMSEWGLINKTIFYLQLPLFMIYFTIMVLKLIGFEFNWLVDGAIVICTWSIFALHVWVRQKKTTPDGKPTGKRLYAVAIVIWGIIGVWNTFEWLVNRFWF